MPAGVSWPTYLKFTIAAGLSMVAGAETVHRFYRPLEHLEEFIEDFEKKVVEAEQETHKNKNKETNKSEEKQ